MPRTIPQQERDRIEELMKVKIPQPDGSFKYYSAYAIAKIIQKENGTLTYPTRVTVMGYMKK